MIIDISQEVFSCAVYPGDPKPRLQRLSDMADGALYNLSSFSMCAHNGTHIDAPAHFFADGKTVEQIDLTACCGRCFVCHHAGDLPGDTAAEILAAARQHGCQQRILLADDCVVGTAAAEAPAFRGGCTAGRTCAVACRGRLLYAVCRAFEPRRMRGCAVPCDSDDG